MAESKSKSRSKSTSRRQSRSSSRSGNNNSRKDRSPKEIVAEAIGQVQELIGKPVEGVTAMEKDGASWNVTVEVVELERIPNTTDVLGSYVVTLDRNGDVTGARRTRRFYRSEAGED